MRVYFSILILFTYLGLFGQDGKLSGTITASGQPLPFANIYLSKNGQGTVSDQQGRYSITNIPTGKYTLYVSFSGYKTARKTFSIDSNTMVIDFDLLEDNSLEEVVVTGTLKAVRRLESPVPVEVYSPTFLKKNPTPNIFEALQNVNGVRPQLNCNVCNTGDIHINGLEGPYTMVLIDGMPIVSGLSTVYGLSGIPNSLIEQVEIVKGPASTLYGSEAVGGLINIITKHPENAPGFFIDGYTSSWLESNLDIGFKTTIGKTASTLFGANYYTYDNPIDNNNDNFTDVTLQDRISLFNKWNIKRKENRVLNVAGRFFYEDRWGGELQWDRSFRGGNEIYGESIYTRRFEVLGNYQLPTKEKLFLSFSYTDHDQNSVYGDIAYLAKQRIGFSQLTYNKTYKKHDLLFGTALRYTYYDDNTPATLQQDEVVIPSLFIQDEIKFNTKHTLLLGGRYDYDRRHGSIVTPRIAYRFKPSEQSILRFNAGTGFRVVNLFTEEHAALTGARDVVIQDALKPERSYNLNINYLQKLYTANGISLSLDTSVWYTYFTNLILPDYDTNPNQIIYDNLNGFANTYGVSTNMNADFGNGLKAIVGATLQEVSNTENGIKNRQILTERFTATWSISYDFYKPKITIDYTGNLYGPMRLPLLGDLDPRSPYSPTWSLQNIQFTYKGLDNFEVYGGIKNLLDWTPNRGNPFLIARANDPFDRDVSFDTNGNVVATPNNPYALSFDPSYVYAPNQGIRGFIGLRYRLQ